MTPEVVRALYLADLEIIRQNRMAYELGEIEPHPQIRTNLGQTEILRLVRIEASAINIRFGSPEAAVYHFKKHPSSDNARYVEMANNLIFSVLSNIHGTFTYIEQDGTIEIEFSGPVGNDGYFSFCAILIKNGKIILKTFVPKKK